MLPMTEQLLQSALALSSEERFLLIEALIAVDQVPPPFEESWRNIIQRRSAEMDAGTATEVPWNEVRQRLRRQVGLDG